MGTLRTGASGRQRTFDRLQDRLLPNTYDPPSFALKLAHKDMRLATELGRELGAPMRLANMAFAEMTEAINRGWENRDSRSPMLLQLERCALKVEVDPQRIQEVLDRDPPLQWRSRLFIIVLLMLTGLYLLVMLYSAKWRNGRGGGG